MNGGSTRVADGIRGVVDHSPREFDDRETPGRRLERRDRPDRGSMDGAGIEKADAVEGFVANEVGVTMDNKVRPGLDGLCHLCFEVTVRRDDSSASDAEPHGRMIDHEIKTACVSRKSPILIDVSEDQANREPDQLVDDLFAPQITEMKDRGGSGL